MVGGKTGEFDLKNKGGQQGGGDENSLYDSHSSGVLCRHDFT